MPQEQEQVLAICSAHSERLATIEANLAALATSVAALTRQVSGLRDEMQAGFAEMRAHMETHYVRREEYEPVKRIVYGLVALMLTGIGVALAELVLRHGHTG